MPRWNPIPSALCHEQPALLADPPAENPKTNGYIFKRYIDGSTSETRYIPKVCRALPAYPKTYGLSCDREDCQHCHPRTAADLPNTYKNLASRWSSYGVSSFYSPRPGSCLVGRRGCKHHKMIRIRPAKKEGVVKNENRRQPARTEQAVGEEQDESKRDKRQRLRKWETLTLRSIGEGCELATSKDVVLPTDDWKAETGDIQLAILASLGLLDDYEAEDADITLNSLPRIEGLYTIRCKSGIKRKNILEMPEQAEAPILDDDVDWELVIGSQSEGSISWTILDE